MKKALISSILALLLGLAANAQPYGNSVGVTFIPDFSGGFHYVGVQWNHFLNEKNSLDFRAIYNRYWGPGIDGMYEWNLPISGSGLRLYAGLGAHLGIVPEAYNGEDCFVFGLTGAAGLEYAFSAVPIAISLDWHPYLTWQPKIDDEATFGYMGLALGVKYCF